MTSAASTVADLILAQAGRTPDAVAVRQWEDRLTYRELVERAAGVANALRELGVAPEARVGICTTRDPAYVATVLGVLLSGGCYVPLDPGGPRQRLLEIAEDAGVSIVVGDSAAAEFGGVPGIRTLEPPPPARPRPCPATVHNTAHVLYTSGSTGRPKGVLTTHRNIVSFVDGWHRLFPIDPSTRVLGVSSLGFDASTIDLFVPLTVGASVQLVSAADRADPERLRRFVVEHEVDYGVITPTMLAMLDPADVPGWTVIQCGGEAVPAELAARWAPGRRFTDAYGPTESTVLVLTEDITYAPEDPLPIGKATPGHRAHVMDELLRPVPRGEVGELLIGGPGLANGYLNRPALTADRFVPDPFAERPGERLYRTGDQVYEDEQGRIVYLGRGDRQVKIRGQRIELGEVEAVLGEHPDVRQAAVEAVDGADGSAGGKRLVAFLTPATAPDDEALREYTKDRLTGAMRPTLVMRLAELTFNPVSGKLDRPTLRALAERALAELAESAAEFAGTPTEQAVARVWRRVLGQAPTRETDFFTGGGNSIAAMRLVAGLRVELGRQVAIEDLFLAPTVAGLAELVAKADPLPGNPLTTGNQPTLAPPQRRLWLTDQLAPEDAPYNIALANRLRGELDLPALRAALRAVADRHDVLRWRIRQTAGVPYADCAPPADVPVEIVDLTATADRESVLGRLLATGARHVFDLATGPAWLVTLYRLAPDEHVLAVTLHHAVFDGWSQAVLYDDLGAAYARAREGGSPALPPLSASYADYAVWRADRDRRHGEADLAWWTTHLAGVPTVVDLPRDRPRAAVQTYTGAEASVPLPSHVDTAVRELAAKLGSTPASVLLGGFGELLARLTGATDHVLGAVVADRGLAAFDDVLGFFIDTVPVRLRAGAPTFADTVRAGADDLREATAHPGAPLEKIVDALGVGRDTSRAPLVQVLFNVLNFTEPRLRLAGLAGEPIEVPKPGSPFDITVYVAERDGRFAFDTVYNPDLFDADRIVGLLTDLTELVGALAAAPDAPAAETAPHLPRRAVREAAAGAMTVDAPDTPELPALAPGAEITATEALIACIWREVLERESVGVADNFFDIGGHSLAVAAVHGRLAAATGRSIRMLDLFRYPNIRALAAHLDGTAEKPELARAALRAAARRNSAGNRGRRNPPRRVSGTAQ
ncbi:MAG: amino acid adenylation domain-containing protein [Actinophytocola sp.]|uniref:amino acid adenylation domain-containing protein n=1 Tax=Actinophytocola sp. TaxID=1872138 RepID=UPI0013239658|nr:amino acid adenylation domain-containing protein [Actinophytocola sp.]MPZ79310.1 amino acid adenylation domain-containing protein [Actinophytocola sp.]